MVTQSSDVTLVLASLAGLLFVGTESIASDPPVKGLLHFIPGHLRSTWDVIKAISGQIKGLSEFSRSFLTKLDGGEIFIRQVIKAPL